MFYSKITLYPFVIFGLAAVSLSQSGCSDFKDEKEKPRVVYTDVYTVREKTSIDDIYPPAELKSLGAEPKTLVIEAEELVLKKDSVLFIEDRNVVFNVKRIVSENGKISTFKNNIPQMLPETETIYRTAPRVKDGGSITINTIDAEGTLELEMYGYEGIPGVPYEHEEFSCGFDTPCPLAGLNGFKGEDGLFAGKCVKHPSDGGDGQDGRDGRAGQKGFPGGGSGSGRIIISGSNSLKITGYVTPGAGGPGGKGMYGQKGGKGGPPGDVQMGLSFSRGPMDCNTAYWGRPGKNGETGPDGPEGESGIQGKFCIKKNETEQVCIPANQ